jgi:hypothetical protein
MKLCEKASALGRVGNSDAIEEIAAYCHFYNDAGDQQAIDEPRHCGRWPLG